METVIILISRGVFWYKEDLKPSIWQLTRTYSNDMNLIRILVLFVVIYLVYSMIKRYMSNRPRKPPASVAHERMVQCAACGLHIPEREALAQGELYYCSKEHLPLR